VSLDLLLLGGGPELDGGRGRVDEVREGQGRVEGPLAWSNLKDLSQVRKKAEVSHNV
jgi:hypothetical protein